MDNGLIDIAAELLEIEEAQIHLLRNPKVYLERQNPLDIYDEESFYTNYRMSKNAANRVIDLIRNDLVVDSNRGLPIPPHIQVLATLRYLAKGAYGTDIAELHGLSQSTLSRVVRRVVLSIALHVQEFIKFPQGEELIRTKEQFYNIAHCPNVVGAIDCTHIKIKNPGGEYQLMYINRKGYYSLNVQMVCNAKGKICDIVARWRGSTHDSRIWNESSLKTRFENGTIDGILLGDNGYPCSRHLLTPLLNPITNAEVRYNRAHVSTRNIIERAFGVMKNKFRCFFNGLNLNIDTTKAAIVAITIVYNIIIDDREEIEEHDLEHENNIVENDNGNGNVYRQHYIQTYFN